MFAGMKSFALLSTEPCASAQVSFLRCALHSLYAWHGMPGSCRQMRGSPVCFTAVCLLYVSCAEHLIYRHIASVFALTTHAHFYVS